MSGKIVPIAIGGVLAVSGIGMAGFTYLSQSHAENIDLTHKYDLVNRNPVHGVTAKMAADSFGLTGVNAKMFTKPTTSGSEFDLSSEIKKRPVMLIFIMDSCPCSMEAQPFFNSLAKSLEGYVTFVGITDGTMEQAKNWRSHYQTPFPIISDPKKDLMRAFDSPESAYSALVSVHGKIARQYPGFSQTLLKQMDSDISHLVNKPAIPLDVSEAPLKATSGCYFYAPAIKTSATK